MNLVFATHNPNKLKEIQALMPEGITIKSLTDIGCNEDIIEDASTIKGNALIKARYVKKHYGYDCFADDTGLEVDTLDGAPGVYSARYAGPQKNDTDNISKLLQALSNSKNRKAQFKTVIALTLEGEEHTFTGICKGNIVEPKGEKGFGYDPIFKPDGYVETFAEMSISLKGKISHRGKAVALLISYLEAKNKGL